MLSVFVIIVAVIGVDSKDNASTCTTNDGHHCLPTYACKSASSKFITAPLCGFDDYTQQPFVCCQTSGSFGDELVGTTLVTPQTIYLTGFVNGSKISTLIKVPTILNSIDDLQYLVKKEALIKFKVTNISRYKRADQIELFTSNPLPEKESNVIPNPVALSVNTTDPPLELFTSPPLPGEANVIPAVVPLQTQSDKPEVPSIMNLFTSAPLPSRGNSEEPTTEKQNVPKTKPPTSRPSPPKHTKKPVRPDNRPIVFEDSLPTTTAKSDQIYYPDQVPGLAQNELDSKLNALSAVVPLSTPQRTLDKLLPNRHTCGLHKNSKRFADSNYPDLDEFPWVALLRYVDNSNNDAGFRCSGTLISDRYVLTAAHCLTMDSLCVDSVRLGEWKVSSAYDCFLYRGRAECADKVMDVKVQRKIIHRHFDAKSWSNDMALLRLHTKVPCTDYVRPICLPIKNLPEPKIGTQFITSGWGTSPFGFQLDIKSKISFPVVHKDYCKQYQYFKEQTCIGYFKRHDFGKMDPGGPVMALDISDKPQWYLEGVISRGYGCNLFSYPGAYTRVTYFIDWLIEALLNDARR